MDIRRFLGGGGADAQGTKRGAAAASPKEPPSKAAKKAAAKPKAPAKAEAPEDPADSFAKLAQSRAKRAKTEPASVKREEPAAAPSPQVKREQLAAAPSPKRASPAAAAPSPKREQQGAFGALKREKSVSLDEPEKPVKAELDAPSTPSTQDASSPPKKRVLPWEASASPPPGATPSTAATATSPEPRGRPFEGPGGSALTVVLTGCLSTLSRDDAIKRVSDAGGKVTGSISGKTSFLVYGDKLEDGRDYTEGSKYKKAKEMMEKGKGGPTILDEAAFLKMLGDAPAAAPEVVATPLPVPAPPPPRASTAGAQNAGPQKEPVVHTLWSEKYRPSRLEDLVGNTQYVKKVETWLRDWEKVVLRGEKKPVNYGKGGNFDNVNAKACLISGAPGIGKSTAVRLIVEAAGYHPIEYNASDSRAKSFVDELAGGVSKNQVLVNGRLAKACLVMEEVDGMGAGDRGGNAALIKMIGGTKMPVLCLCNDRMDSKVRTLANHCYDIKFAKPPKNMIAQRVCRILATEGCACDATAVEQVAESCGNDIRQVLNQLQLMFKTVATSAGDRGEFKSLTFSQVTENMQSGQKDASVMLGPFDVAKQLLTSSSRQTLNQRLDSYFVDADLVPLLVHENYLRAVRDDFDLRRVAQAADLFVHGDLLNNAARSTQSFGLMPSIGLVSVVYPASVMNGFLSFPTFPQWLGKQSSTNKSKRLCQELQANLWAHSTGRSRHVRLEYADLLYDTVVAKLQGEKEGATEAVDFLNAYGLTREHVLEHLTQLRLPDQADPFKDLSPAVKAAFTRAFNSSTALSRTVNLSMAKKGGGAAVPSAGRRGADGEPLDEEVEAEEDDAEKKDDEEKDSKDIRGLVAKAKAKAKAKGAPKKKAPK